MPLSIHERIEIYEALINCANNQRYLAEKVLLEALADNKSRALIFPTMRFDEQGKPNRVQFIKELRELNPNQLDLRAAKDIVNGFYSKEILDFLWPERNF